MNETAHHSNSVIKLSPEQVAAYIQQIYKESFCGKKEGRFQMSRKQFKTLAGRQHLHDTYSGDVIEACYTQQGIAMTELDDGFAFVRVKVKDRYRKLTKEVFDDTIKIKMAIRETKYF